MDYYPPGLQRLPDDDKTTCSECYTDHYVYKFKRCKECDEQAVCPTCNECNECGVCNE